jgi:hypothetical protein
MANYLDALNASRVRIHLEKPKALDLKFGLRIYVASLHQGSPAAGCRGAFFFAVMGCSGLARTGIGPI